MTRLEGNLLISEFRKYTEKNLRNAQTVYWFVLGCFLQSLLANDELSIDSLIKNRRTRKREQTRAKH